MAIGTKQLGRKKTYVEQCQDIIQKYIDAGSPWPAPMRRVAEWAFARGLWDKKPPSALQLCARDLSRAARQEYVIDPQGRSVRRFHAFRKGIEIGEEYVQQTLWTEIHDAMPDDMQLALQQRRLGVLGDCRQLKTDTDSYNDNNPHGAEIQLSLDFTHDVAELEMPTEYNPGLPPDEDD